MLELCRCPNIYGPDCNSFQECPMFPSSLSYMLGGVITHLLSESRITRLSVVSKHLRFGISTKKRQFCLSHHYLMSQRDVDPESVHALGY